MYNVFKAIELPDTCPPAVKEELFSEIGLIRNSLTVVEVYVDDLFGVASMMFTDISGPLGSSLNRNRL